MYWIRNRSDFDLKIGETPRPLFSEFSAASNLYEDSWLAASGTIVDVHDNIASMY